jgi:uncharacterized protein involved in exopolysaccharide biosynthesis
MSKNELSSTKSSGDIEISIVDIFLFLKTNLKSILVWGILSGIIGFVFAFTAQKEFESKTQLMPELQSSSSLGKMGGLSALAGLAGIDLNQMGGTDAVRPDLYPNIVQSLPFSLFLLKQPVYVSEYKKTMTLEEYFKQKDNSWLSSILGNNEKKEQTPLLDPKKSSNAYELTKPQQDLINEIQKRVVTTFDRKTGVITINTKMPDPVVAATTAQKAVEYLKEYVTTYRTDKARSQVKFLFGQMSDAKSRYQSAEARLASYRDENRFLSLQTAKIDEQRLQADYILAQNVYNNLAQQYEQAKIRVEEETPVFKTLEPAIIPLKRSEPKRTLIVIGFGLIGIIIGIAISIFKKNALKIWG